MAGMPVTLRRDEMLHACMVGCTRQINNVIEGAKDMYGAPPWLAYQSHVEGALGEKCLAKYLGVYWSGELGNRRAHDVAGYQVRATARDDGCLILHPRDADDDRFVLVTGSGPSFYIRGWIKAADGKLAEYWREREGGRSAFFVPQVALESMRSLDRAA